MPDVSVLLRNTSVLNTKFKEVDKKIPYWFSQENRL